MAGQKELHLLRDREFQVHQAAVAQHHQEEAQASARGTDRDGSPLAPVDLGAFARGEVEFKERGRVVRPNAVHVVLDDGDAALKARLAQPLVDLLCAVRVGIEPTYDLALVGIELAHARHAGARAKLFHAGPLGYRARIQCERTGSLRDSEPLATEVIADLAEGLIVEHGDAPSDRGFAQASRGRRQKCAPALVQVPVVEGAARFQKERVPGTAGPDRRQVLS